jgi:hypothetical protein
MVVTLRNQPSSIGKDGFHLFEKIMMKLLVEPFLQQAEPFHKGIAIRKTELEK